MAIWTVFQICRVNFSWAQLFGRKQHLLPICEWPVVNSLQIGSIDFHRLGENELATADTHHRIIRTDLDYNWALVVAKGNDISILSRDSYRPSHAQIVLESVQNFVGVAVVNDSFAIFAGWEEDRQFWVEKYASHRSYVLLNGC